MAIPSMEEINEALDRDYPELPSNLIIYNVEDLGNGHFKVSACTTPDEDEPDPDYDDPDNGVEILFPPGVTTQGVLDELFKVFTCPHGSPLADTNGCAICMSAGKAVIK